MRNNKQHSSHSQMDHGKMEHSEMDHSVMDHSEMDHGGHMMHMGDMSKSSKWLSFL